MLLLPASITLRESRDTQRLLSQALQGEQHGEVVIDASPLQQCDTSALAVLLECRRLAQAWGRAFSVRNPPEKLASLAKLYGVADLLFAAAPVEPDPSAN
ncbi:STAS domain-containing protein [Rhizobacter sp. AJA081-3]|uniref:STAS domain-containing protein n=1 Tax=Rhizobacter sp. AJA081-3 TaxID=2753607 RepID=UPI001ADED9ED|nr:STAS domain-containing protein [Rhizobacter sp. AJA081-3]QTN22346.1 STAS domain-containing protein [Rhizobacter sp. AJA081-3]